MIKKVIKTFFVLLLIITCVTSFSSTQFLVIRASDAGVVVNSDEATTIDLSQIDGDIIIKKDGLYVGGDHVDAALNPNGYRFSKSTTLYSITVAETVTTTIILDNVNITLNAKTCIQTTRSNTTIMLVGDNVLDCTNMSTGGCLMKNGVDDYTLTIKELNEGSLSCTGHGMHTAAIGSRYVNGASDADTGFSNLIIESGTIKATAGEHSPGIGCNCTWYYNHKAITKNVQIKGGVVNATGGNYCAGIGSGLGTPVDGIYISGGANVTAHGGAYSPGIGSGGADIENENVDVSNIEISGGNTIVTAYGDVSSNAPAIGCGVYDSTNKSYGALTNVLANPTAGYQGFIKYGNTDTDFEYSKTPLTPFNSSSDFGNYLKKESETGASVIYVQVYFALISDKGSVDGSVYLSCNDTVSKTGGNPFPEYQIITLTRPKGKDELGNDLDFNKIVMNQEDFAALNKAKVDGEVGNYSIRYSYTYNDPKTGTQKVSTIISTVSLRDEGMDTVDGRIPNIAANNAIHKTGGSGFSDEEIIELCDVLANDHNGANANYYDNNGKLIINPSFVIDPELKKQLNDAKEAGKVGEYKIKFYYEDYGVIVDSGDIIVSLRGDGTSNLDHDSPIPEIGANDSVTKTGGKALSQEEIKALTRLIGKDKNGQNLELKDIKINPDDLKALNQAKTSGQIGEYPITYSFTDKQGKMTSISVNISLRDNGSDIKDFNQDNPIATYGADNVTYQDQDGIKQALQILIDSKMKYFDQTGNEITDLSSFSVNNDQLDYLNKLIKANRSGTYPISFTTLDNVVITIQVTLVPDASKTSNKISGKDFIYNPHQGAISENDALKLANIKLSNNRISNLDNVSINKEQLKALNEAIKAGKSGQYSLTFIDKLTGEEVTIIVSLENTKINNGNVNTADTSSGLMMIILLVGATYLIITRKKV